MIIKRVGPLSCARIVGTLYAAVGVIIGAIVSVVVLAGGVVSGSPESGGASAVFGAGAIILAPIVYGCIGFVVTAIGAALYNVVASVVGGVQVDVE